MSCGEITPRMRRAINFANTGTALTPINNSIVYSNSKGLVLLPSGNNGILITSGSGAPSISSTLPSAVQDNITRLGTIVNGSWNATGGFFRLNGAASQGMELLASTVTALMAVTQTGNTSGQHALFKAEVAGTNSGSDPLTNYKNSDATNGFDWAVGGKSSTKNFTISNNATLGTNDNLIITPAGATSILRGNFDVTRSASAANVTATVSNTNNASGTANAILIASVGGTSGGDASWQVTNGTTTISGGLDNSATQYSEQYSATVGTTPHRIVSTAGVQTMPLQPVFNAWKTGGAGNVTGDGTVSGALVDAQNQQGSCYTGNQTYTAKATGYHLLIMSVQFTNLSATFTHGDVRIVTTAETFIPTAMNVGAVRDASNNATFSASCIAKMAVGDTAIINYMASGGTKVVGIGGAATAITAFSGLQLC